MRPGSQAQLRGSKKATSVRPYEVIVLMHPDSSEEDQKTLFKKNKAIIEDQFEGAVNHLDTWGKRSLANPIGKNKKAVFFFSTFSAKPSAIAELERTMRINDKVLRFMHTALDPRTDLSKYLESFRNSIAESAAREREREAKFQARKAARGGPRRDDDFRGGRRDDFGSGRGEDDSIDGDMEPEDEV